jgi:RNA-binding protein 26
VFRALAETQHFINLLFNAIRSQSYLPYNTSPPPTPTQPYNNSNPSAPTLNGGGIPIPLDPFAAGPSNALNPRKRGLDNPPDEHDHRKGPRLSTDPGHPGRGRGGRGQRDGRGGGRGRDGGPGEPSGEYGGNRPQQYRPPDQMKRGICRDYHSEWPFLRFICICSS